MAPGQKHLEKLIGASIALFRRQGYAATGLAEILADSGAPKGSLYHYFPDGKEGMAEAAIRTVGVKFEGMVRALAAEHASPGALITAYATSLAQALKNSGFTDGCPVATLMLEVAPQSERLMLAGRDVLAGWSEVLRERLALAGVSAERAQSLADFAISAVEGALLLARVRQSTAPIERAAEELVRLINLELTKEAV